MWNNPQSAARTVAFVGGAEMTGKAESEVELLLNRYILDHDVSGATVDYYRRVVRVFTKWANQRTTSADFSAETISRFLMDLQAKNKSPSYRKSLRNGLLALLRYTGCHDRVRPVKIPDLEPDSWTAEEVSRLVECAKKVVRWDDIHYWPTIVASGYYSGLAQIDLELLTPGHIGEDGTIDTRRSKTGKRVRTWMPADILELRPRTGRLWPRDFTLETFRKQFARIVGAAGLEGTFKKLRKTSGTEFDVLYPGRGHEHLANGRAVFERHYKNVKRTSATVHLPLLTTSLSAHESVVK